MTDSRPETYAHIAQVRAYLHNAVFDLLARSHRHDNSKLRPPELEGFDEVTARLKTLDYDTPEYHASLHDLGAVLAHHYEHNDHHPEHFENGVWDMSLLQVTEMLCDWLAAVKRMGGSGDIYESIELNQRRFGYSDDFKQLLINSVPELGGPEK